MDDIYMFCLFVNAHWDNIIAYHTKKKSKNERDCTKEIENQTQRFIEMC